MNLSAENQSLENNSSDAVEPLPLAAVALAPLILLELVVAILSNAILLALVVLACARKYNNNINIYLFSLSIAGFTGAFSTFCTFILLLARRWVLGDILCIVNAATFNASNVLYLLLYLIISRDKYIVARGSFLSRPSTKRAYRISVAAWIVTIVFVALSSWNIMNNILNSVDNEHFRCFGFSSQRSRSMTQFVLAVTLVGVFWLLSTIVIGISLFNFARILLELHKLNKLRQRFSEQSRKNRTIRINERDRPLYTTAEERTAKSLALVFFIQLFAIFISYGMSYIQIIRSFALPEDSQDGPNYQIYFVVILIAQLFPTTNPAYLILSNKRLRKRVKGLFKCKLNPDIGSPTHRGATVATKPRHGIPFKYHMRSKVFPQVIAQETA